MAKKDYCELINGMGCVGYIDDSTPQGEAKAKKVKDLLSNLTANILKADDMPIEIKMNLVEIAMDAIKKVVDYGTEEKRIPEDFCPEDQEWTVYLCNGYGECVSVKESASWALASEIEKIAIKCGINILLCCDYCDDLTIVATRDKNSGEWAFAIKENE